MHHSKQKLTVELQLLQRRPLLRKLQDDSYDDTQNYDDHRCNRAFKVKTVRGRFARRVKKVRSQVVVAENYECRLFNHLIQGFLLLFLKNEVKYKILFRLLVCHAYHQIIFYVYNYVTFSVQVWSLRMQLYFEFSNAVFVVRRNKRLL